MFKDPTHQSRWPTTLACALHGDEGRGLKKGHTCVLMLESTLGLDSTPLRKRKAEVACDCQKRCRTLDGYVSCKQVERQRTNLRHHCYLTKWTICALPNKMVKVEDESSSAPDPLLKLMEIVCDDLRSLAVDGILINGTRWWLQLTGFKGDQDWFRKVCLLKRCWKQQISLGKPMCMECGAGPPGVPFEDVSGQARWRDTLWFERPWGEESKPPVEKIVFEAARPERCLRRDLFHLTKQGTFRDFIAGATLLLMWLGYWDDEFESNDRPHLFTRAHSSFKMWCMANSVTPGLRSFSPLFFNAASWNSYGWVNCKGSDCMHLIKWLRVQCFAFLQEMKDRSHEETLRMIMKTAEYAIAFTQMTYSHGLWLPRHCAWALWRDLDHFLRGYTYLAHLAKTQHSFTAFGMKGKMHLIAHLKEDVRGWLSDRSLRYIINPQAWGCESNEDTVGRVSRLSRRVHQKHGARRTLELVLIKSKAVHRRFMAEHGPARRI